LAILI